MCISTVTVYACQDTYWLSSGNFSVMTVNITQVSHSDTFKLTSYISEFKDDGLSVDKILFCNLCLCEQLH